MGIWFHGERLEIRFEQNIRLIPQLLKVSPEASDDATPPAQRPLQPSTPRVSFLPLGA